MQRPRRPVASGVDETDKAATTGRRAFGRDARPNPTSRTDS
ncbi:hypothetical protein [Haloplanus vescus]|nr:hypothetical protein [Haloplanus vescus]